ncbi:MAG: hypothetical protein IIW37_01070 [Bacteroidaceae bacterium]|nr:hypothetical protein [Bacteroidaceae bacterium]MBQ5880541.1 hypothetical protein [Bacteroidaceae bacterium]
MRLGDGWAGLKIPMGFSRKSAVLAEFFAVLVENSKRLADFCLFGRQISCKVSGGTWRIGEIAILLLRNQEIKEQ